MIIVEPTSGLCSRIFVLCDAYDLAKMHKKKLVILWKQTADCNCNYYDIFDISQFKDIDCKVIQFSRYGIELRNSENFKSFDGLVRISKEICRRIWFGITYYPVRCYYKARCSVYKNAYIDGNVALTPGDIKNCSIYIEAYNGIHFKYDVSSVRFAEAALKEAEEILRITNGNCVGVHIRRTDHEPAKSSLTERFIDKMIELLENDSSMYFYLATDDWTEQEILISRFGEHIITQKEKTLTRATGRGMHSSMIDFLCLSRTKYILGSYSSMFSEFSARLGGIELIII